MASEAVSVTHEAAPSTRYPTTREFPVLGLAVWLVASVAFRLVRQSLLDLSRPLVIGALFVAAGPAMIGLPPLRYRWRGVAGWDRLASAVAQVLPGMPLDARATAWFGTVFPNVAPGAATSSGGLLRLAYASVLLSGFVPR